MTSLLLAQSNEFDVQIQDSRVWAMVILIAVFVVAGLIALSIWRITETRVTVSRQKTEQYRLDVKKAEAQRDETVVRNGYKKWPDGSISPVGKELE